ncbi:CPBP family intramembrane glutamic endopeptidase [Halorubrum distributum]|uniref:CPBP family intramembrane glutamic endopeptidase n=1 Tax=Halorubrum distributum TaxID=29283 RepID=UPI0006781B97|nr:CPBP family intramembrane glutamic endopeptidase [Halorubrum arcis]
MPESPSTPTTTIPERLGDKTGIARTGAFLAVVVLVTIAANLAAILAVVATIGRDAGGTITFITGTIGTELSFLLIGMAYLRVRSNFHLPLQIPGRTAVPYLLGGLLASFVTAFLSLAVTDAIIPAVELSPGYMEYSNLGGLTGFGLIFAVVLSLTVIGPVEEFFFRGVIQGRLQVALGPRSAIGVASMIFALFHVYPVALLSPPGIVIAHMVVYYTFMGMIFGWVYRRTNTLIGPAFVHGTFNAVIFSLPFWN